MMRLLAISCVAMAVSAPALHAETYECTMTNRGTGGWVGEKVILSIDRGNEVGAALDWAIYQKHKAPVPVSVTKRKEYLWRFKWSVPNMPTANGRKHSVSYVAMLDTLRQRVTLQGYLSGYDNNISGQGSCKKVG